MLDEATVRADLEKTAKKIICQETWPIYKVAEFLGYSRNYIDMVLEKKKCIIVRKGGRKHVYAIDVLEMFERQNGFEFPEPRAQWCKKFKITPL